MNYGGEGRSIDLPMSSFNTNTGLSKHNSPMRVQKHVKRMKR